MRRGYWWIDNGRRNGSTRRKTCHRATILTIYMSNGVNGARTQVKGAAIAAWAMGRTRGRSGTLEFWQIKVVRVANAKKGTTARIVINLFSCYDTIKSPRS
jgi:hypothetical protein